jgi:hypothetical protein
MNKATFKKAYRQLLANVAKDLLQQGLKVFDKLTEDEKTHISTFLKNQTTTESPFRLARAILVAIADTDYIECQWSAECLTQHVRKVKKAIRNRP